MKTLDKKIDFAVIFTVKNANPNGDPLNGNRPRVDYNNYGEVTDVCLKRKIRDRLQDSGECIFVQSDDKKTDKMKSLKERYDAFLKEKSKSEGGKKFDRDDIIKFCCVKWIDVRSFGQLFAYKKGGQGEGVSIPIRGPVTIQSAFSVEPVSITSIQITKSVSGETSSAKKKTNSNQDDESEISQEDNEKKSSDTMGMKHRVDNATYVTFGSMNPQLAVSTGFNNEDADAIKKVLPKLFEGDSSSSRPEGSMEIKKVIWWEHDSLSGQYSSAQVHRTLIVHSDGTYKLNNLSRLTPKEIDGR